MDKKEFVTVPLDMWKLMHNICEKSYNNTYGYVEEQFGKLIDIIETVNNKEAIKGK